MLFVAYGIQPLNQVNFYVLEFLIVALRNDTNELGTVLREALLVGVALRESLCNRFSFGSSDIDGLEGVLFYGDGRIPIHNVHAHSVNIVNVIKMIHRE
ncbi:MAG: hypothetical protein RBS80_14545 [Thermoguttaceae bacterium]|nr:hypothetical protein [Thermoguttaceae bacterium]